MENTPLASKHCKPCKGGIAPLSSTEIQNYLKELTEGWKVVSAHHIEKEYTFTDFRHALNFTNLIGQIAENEGHHPEIHLGYGKVKLLIWTHKINGLTESDFILAAKMDQEYPISCQKACF